MKRLIVVVLLPFAVVLGATAQKKSPAQVQVADLAFISGHWQGAMDKSHVEEHWSTPRGDNMIGMFRWMSGEKIRLYELLAIEQEATGPVLRLKHFSRGLVGRDEKNVALNFSLASFKPNEARFETEDKNTALIFRRLSPTELEVTLEKVKDGKRTSSPFRYRQIE